MYRRTIPVILSALLLTFSSVLFIGCSSSSTPATPNEQPVNNPVPTISTLSAASVILGSDDLSLTVTGTNFTPTTKISFGTDVLTPATVGATTLTVAVPKALLATAKIIPVTASNPTPGGGTSNAVNFTIGYPLPTLGSSVASSTLLNSTSFTLEIDGHGFTAATRLHFGTDELTPASVTESHIAVPVPDALLTVARLVPVTASNPEPLGGTSNSIEFSVNNPIPVIASLSVDTAEVGLETDLALDVTGTNFVSGAVIEFGGHKLTPGSGDGAKLSA
ncbi:MAG: IPT/TIG domain-containing protein, partial [Terracidiphilus sp.]